uniref:Amino acid transporter transmembrane domain-containing protein n=1 Tax=Parascaris univalens TaxID=6257 RepID=A0A915BZX5_PARUN
MENQSRYSNFRICFNHSMKTFLAYLAVIVAGNQPYRMRHTSDAKVDQHIAFHHPPLNFPLIGIDFYNTHYYESFHLHIIQLLIHICLQ